MPDERTPGEVARNVQQLRQDLIERLDRLDRRISDLSRDMVPVSLHNSDLARVGDRITSVQKDVSDLEKSQETATQTARQARYVAVSVGVAALGVLISLLTFLRSGTQEVTLSAVLWMVGAA